MNADIIPSPLNPLRFVVKVLVPHLSYEDYLGACEDGRLGPVDDAWLTEDQWRIGEFIRALDGHAAVQWLRAQAIPHQLVPPKGVAEFPIVLQLFDGGDAERFRASL